MALTTVNSDVTSDASDLLSCSVCMYNFDESDHQPKLLPCHHTFCKGCLMRMARGQQFIDCPTCRQRIKLSAPLPDGIASLQTNFYITQMKDLINDGSRPKAKGCRKHGNNSLDHFCQTCEVLICEDCVDSDHKETAGHITQELEVAIHEQKQLLEGELTEAQHTVTASSVHLKHFSSEAANLAAAKMKALEEIDAAFDGYVEVMNKRRQQLREYLVGLYHQRRHVVESEAEDIKKKSNALASLIEQCMGAIQCGQISDILAYKAKLTTKNQEINSLGDNRPNIGNNYLTYSADESEAHFLDLIRDLGCVQLCGALPSVVKVTEQPAIACLFGGLTVKITSCVGEELENYPIAVEIIDAFDDVLPCTVQHRNNGLYHATFRPQHSGLHRVRVKFHGFSIPGGEFNMNVLSNNPVLTFGQRGSSTTDMDYPRAVAVDDKSNIFVVDTGNNRIQMFDKKARFLYQFPISEEMESYSSCGIAVDNTQGTVICPEVCVQEADLAHASAVLIYTKDGQLLHRFVYRDILKRALSVAVNSLGHTIIADYELNTIFLFDRNGKLLRQFGSSGTGPGQFHHPTFVCIGRKDNIIVSDGENDRIQVFDKMGKFLCQFGGKGNGKGQLNLPFGVAADKHGNILVVDGSNKRIQIFKEHGEFIGCIESLGDKMSAPRGIAVTSNGHVLVADRDNHCVKKYKYLHRTTH